MNQNIKTLDFFHKKFNRFSFRLNQYYHENAKDSLSRVPTQLTFSDGEQEVSLSSFYEQVTRSENSLPSATQKSLNTSADELMQNVRQLLLINRKLNDYVVDRKYLTDAELEIPYKLLNQSRIVFYDFAISKDELESKIDKSSFSLSKKTSQSKYKAQLMLWESILTSSKKLLYGIKKNYTLEVKQATTELENQLAEFHNSKKRLKKLRREGRPAYKEFILKAGILAGKTEELIAIGKEFQAEGSMEGEFASYKIFHESALPVYNIMIAQYDKLNIVVQGSSPNKMKEVPWLKIAKPSSLIVLNSDGSPLANALPNNLVFLLDVSGSMELEERLPLLKKSVEYLVQQMRAVDKISIVTYSGKAKIALPSVSANEKNKIYKALKNLKSKGESNALAGLKLAYEELNNNFIEGGNNRVLIATDGGIQINSIFLKEIGENALGRKYLSVFYFGNKEVRHRPQLENLAKIGVGNYSRITPENIREKLIHEANSIGME